MSLGHELKSNPKLDKVEFRALVGGGGTTGRFKGSNELKLVARSQTWFENWLFDFFFKLDQVIVATPSLHI